MQLTGPILDYVSGMAELDTFAIPGNNFTGSFSSSFVEDHPNLIIVDLSQNSFTGSLPLNFDNLRFLTELDLSGNEFSGPIPTNLGNGNFGKYICSR